MSRRHAGSSPSESAVAQDAQDAQVVAAVVGGVRDLADEATLLGAERKVPASVLVLAGSSVVQVPGAASALVEVLASGVDPLDIRKDPREMVRDEAYAAKIRSSASPSG
jgi:hypothetical protein